MTSDDTSIVTVKRLKKKIGLQLADVGSALLDFLLPRLCLGCRAAGTYLCAECERRVAFESGGRCPGCFEPNALGLPCLRCVRRTPIDRLLVACSHRQPLVRDLVRHLKYHAVRELAQPIGALLIRYLEHLDHQGAGVSAPDLVIPVPLHRRRALWRGFNQAELVAEPVASRFGWPLASHLLGRVRYRRPQVGLGANLRRRNVHGAFQVVHPQALVGQSVLLVDDVITSGSTVAACAAELKTAGAKSVTVLALAHG